MINTTLELKNKIKETGYLENIKKGMIFHSQYPNLYKEFIEATKDIEQTLYVNKYLRARLIFLFKYDNNLENIKRNGKWLTFDRITDDFVDRTGEYVKAGWANIKNKLDESIFYSKEETINILKENEYYKTLLGKSKNRTLIKDNSKLYNSIFIHTKDIEHLDKNSKKFSVRILFLVKDNGEINAIKCKSCKENITSFNYSIMYFCDYCINCYWIDGIKYPSKEWFKKKYNSTWELEYSNYKEKVSTIKVNSKQWFQNKYGTDLGLVKYNEDALKRTLNLENLKSKKYSEISQEIFWLIYNHLNDADKKECFFKTLNKEYFIRNESEGKIFFVDFKYKNKIIEYDGKYWHSKNIEKDKIRDATYKNLGYEILILNEDDFRRGNKNSKTITKCINFLNSES